MQKILIVGKLRSGKSEAANHLRYEHDFTEIAFGSMLKHYAHKVFTHNDGGKPRALYQNFGEKCREIDPLVWVRHAEFAYNQAINDSRTKGIVISDGRQPHEIQWARENGFKLVRVTAPDELRVQRATEAGDVFNADDLSHDTEQYVDGYAVYYEIVNSGSLTELWKKIDEIITKTEAV